MSTIPDYFQRARTPSEVASTVSSFTIQERDDVVKQLSEKEKNIKLYKTKHRIYHVYHR